MAGMGSHGRHRHRASTSSPAGATASAGGSSGSTEVAGRHAGVDRPTWQVNRSAVDSRAASAVDGPGALGWDSTLDGLGALDGLGLGAAGTTGAFPVPQPVSWESWWQTGAGPPDAQQRLRQPQYARLGGSAAQPASPAPRP